MMEPERFSALSADLYFLIHKFLSGGPLKRTLRTFDDELEECKILPKRLDWLGETHERTVEDLEQEFPIIRPDYLLQLCRQSATTTNQLLSKSDTLFNLRKEKQNEYNFKQLFDYVQRRYMIPLKTENVSSNILNILRGREISGPLTRNWIISPKLYNSIQFQRRTLGHLSAVYCVLFDHSGRYIITGADDLLIKLWSSRTGRLIHTFRGASSEITDISINLGNTLLAAGSIDRMLRIWELQTGIPIAVLTGHTGMITSVNFCPSQSWNWQYLITTSTDGSVAFWVYNSNTSGKVEFSPKPTVYQERMRPGQAQMICSSFSPGGTFLATGSADHHVRVYYMKSDEGPHRILEIEAHNDRVDSIQWAHSGLRFLSGSKDGTAIIWTFECQQWKTLYLNMNTKLLNTKKCVEDSKKLRVSMVAWDKSDELVVTAVSDRTLKIWNSHTGQLEKVLSGHTDEVYVLEPHPRDKYVILSAGHDGQLFIWDMIKGEIVTRFTNTIEGQGYGAIFDVKWSPDGTMIAATDSHGHLLIFGFGKGNSLLENLPKELFFHTDYRPLVRDTNNFVLDEQTQIPPHAMPPPFLVDIDGNPYPPMLQRLVPGREHCKTEQLVPSIVLGNEGTQEVIQVVSDENPRPRNSRRGSNRRVGNPAGIRHTTGDWQGDSNIKWIKYILVPPLKNIEKKCIKEPIEIMEKLEMKEYHRQLSLRPHIINISVPNENDRKKNDNSNKRRLTKLYENPYKTVVIANSSDDDVFNDDDSDFSTSGYSDWVADEDIPTKPKKRTTRRKVNYNNDDDDSDNDDDSVNDDDDDDENSSDSPYKAPSLMEVDGESINEDIDVKTLKAAASTSTSNIPIKTRHKQTVPDMYKTSEWLTEVKPKKAPYFPQMGDELVYFPQGHLTYIETVQAKQIYEINNKIFPWYKVHLRSHEFVKVVDITYEIKPPRICCLKLALLDEQGRLTGKLFTVKYHDMPDVLDFFVLKQHFDVAMSRTWNIGDKFRCLIDDGWWNGEIVAKSDANEDFPHSLFLCYEINWGNNELDRMSPWDMEPLDQNRIPENCGEALPVLEEELENILYKPTNDDWPNTSRNIIKKHIVSGISKVMELAIAEPFLVPVDLSVYPAYAFIVEYPIDLSTIKERFDNNFYRRVTSAQFDIRHLAINAEKFNERHSIIVKNAKILTELCLRVVKQCAIDVDINALYHQLMDTYDSSDTEVDVEVLPSNSKTLRLLPNRYLKHPNDWKLQARSFVDAIFEHNDSVPFRNPVNSAKYPDYHRIILNPMDLSTVKEKLSTNQYDTPFDFKNDMYLIFNNSRTYNTNKRSRIYVMTVRLAAMFEDHINKIINTWKIVKRRSKIRDIKSNINNNINTNSINNNNDNDRSNVVNNDSKQLSVMDTDSEDDNTPLFKLQKKNSMNRQSSSSNQSKSNSSDKSFKLKKESEEDSEDSFKPKQRKLNLRKTKQTLSIYNDENSSENSNISDNSDDKPLITQVKRKLRPTRNKKITDSTEEEEDDGEEAINTSETTESEDSDDLNVNNTKKVYTSVSSRGRLRKLTPRARALIKK